MNKSAADNLRWHNNNPDQMRKKSHEQLMKQRAERDKKKQEWHLKEVTKNSFRVGQIQALKKKGKSEVDIALILRIPVSVVIAALGINVEEKYIKRRMKKDNKSKDDHNPEWLPVFSRPHIPNEQNQTQEIYDTSWQRT